jgi:mono/diheme cytochrome c family protein
MIEEEQSMKRLLSMVLVSILLLLFVAACGGETSEEVAEEEHVEEEHMEAEDEHMEEEMDMEEGMDMDHAHVEAPDEFASLTNPFAGDADAIAAGKEIFVTNCVTCHGPEGAGDGAAAEGLDPKPADLGDTTMMTTLSDGYLFWRVSKGGAMEPFNSAMIAWEGALSEEQRWQVISYARTFTEQ